MYSIDLASLEGKANLLVYKWAPNDLIFRLFLAQTASNQHGPPPLSQYIQCLMEAALEESDIIGDFNMGSKPDVEGFSYMWLSRVKYSLCEAPTLFELECTG